MDNQALTAIITAVLLGVICLVVCFQFLKMFFRAHEQSEETTNELPIEDPQAIQVIIKQSPLHVFRTNREEDPVAPV